GAISTKDPQRDFLIVKSLINNQADCVIFPEGMMVKNKKITSDGDFRLFEDGQVQRPRTGAATLALQTEFYRERLRRMIKINIKEFDRLIDEYEIKSPKDVMDQETCIVPVNITYYPVRAKENFLSKMALTMIEKPSKRVIDELLTEGTMIFSGVDVDIRFGNPIYIRDFPKDYFFNSFIESDLTSRRKINFSNRLSSYHSMKANANELMNRYMKSVYEMTTLNYDHIFASILKYLPHNRPKSYSSIDQYDLRCRAFLATFACEMSLHCNFHKSLYSSQIHIVTDDRFHRYEDFITLAIETGIIEKRDGLLYINNEKFGIKYSDSMQYEFHTVRVENPISVIANEVEPLVKLQAYLADLAMKSPSKIALMMSYRIEDKHYNSYIDDFTKYIGILPIANPFNEIGEVSDSYYNNGSPRLLRSDSDEIGVLLIHDYLSSPGELLYFANYIHNRGFTVYIPRLPGHGIAPENLTEIESIEWIESVEEGFVLLKSLCKTMVVGGLGVGAMLGLELHLRLSDIDALFMIAPPRIIKDYPSEFITSTKLWSQKIKRAMLPKGDKDEWITYLPEISEFRYSTYPVSSVKQVEIFLEHVDDEIKQLEKIREKDKKDKIKSQNRELTGAVKNYDILKPLNRDMLKPLNRDMLKPLNHDMLKPLNHDMLKPLNHDMLKSLLIVQSRDNPFVNPDGAEKLFEIISAKLKEYYIFDVNNHFVFRGKDRDRIASAVVGFIEAATSKEVN
ncbi:MAG: hypothetical protein HQK63_07680, partial [Desulfamplus sp.]|nr:hypothetical protein [Desulfamplus sp.]